MKRFWKKFQHPDGRVENFQSTSELLIRKARELELKGLRNCSGFYRGSYATAITGSGLEYRETRKYVAGESIRMIDWNITARTNEPHIKTFMDERRRNVFIALDLSSSMNTGFQDRSKLEFALETTATLAWSAIRAGDRIAYCGFSDHVLCAGRAAYGRRALRIMLIDFLKSQKMLRHTESTNIFAALSTCGNNSGDAQTALFVISDFFDPEFPAEFKAIRNVDDISLIRIFDPLEEKDSSHVRLPLFNPEGQRSLAFCAPKGNSRSKSIRSSLDAMENRQGLTCVHLSVNERPEGGLMHLFHRKRKRFH